MADKKIDWVKIALVAVSAVLSIFGIYYFSRSAAEERKKIDAQNEVARLSKVVQEDSNTWSKLSQQKEDIISILRQQNSQLADMIDGRDEQILGLTNVVANFRPTRIIVTTPTQETVPGESGDRLRVSFDEVSDPIHVSGFTLTNPPEAEVTVGYVRPLRLHTVITQQRNGSWRTYVTGDWPNLDIQQVDTTVNPLPARTLAASERVSFLLNAGISPGLDSGILNVAAMYQVGDSFAFGPQIGGAIVNGEFDLFLGVQTQYFPWR